MNPRRLRDYGLAVGSMPTGHHNDITDVPGVSVGHATIDTARHKTGVTVILPAPENTYANKLTAAAHIINGYGKTAGLMQIQELGTLETPIVLTGTLNVGKMCDALVGYTIERCAAEGKSCRSVNPVVGETNDGTLSAGMDRPAGAAHLRAAIAEAERLRKTDSETFAQGDVGAGKGTVCHGLKGGIGSASRVMDIGGQSYTLGVLVQTNYGCIEDLRLDGLPVGRAVLDMIAAEQCSANESSSATEPSAIENETQANKKALRDKDNETVANPIEGQDDIGSIMILVATDLPLSELQLGRVLRRATVGLCRMGSHIGHGSGDVVIGFTTANRRGGEAALRSVAVLNDDLIEQPFHAIAECVEEAIANSLVAADRVTGFDGEHHVTVRALSEFLPEAIGRARRMVAAPLAGTDTTGATHA